MRPRWSGNGVFAVGVVVREHGAVTTGAKIQRVGMPWVLWRLLTGDVWQLLAVTSMSLVLLIAFAAAIKPLADGRVGLGDALTLTFLLVVPMLQFALPFAAGFAATLGYHRFAADNEALAAHAGGIGHRALLMPAAVTGVVLAVVLAGLSTSMIPRFLRSAERIVTRDATRVFVTPIERGETVKIGNYDIHAERVLRLPVDEAKTDAIDHLALINVFAIEAGEDDPKKTPGYITAGRVDLWVFDRPGDDESGTAVQLVFTKASGDLNGQVIEGDLPTRRLPIPGAFRDDPKFLSVKELLRVYDEPRRMSSVEQRFRALALRLSADAVVRELDQSMRKNGHAVLVGDDTEIVVLGAGLEEADGAWKVLAPKPGVPVTMTLRRPRAPGGGDERVQRAKGAVIEVNEPDARTPAGLPLSLSLTLTGVETFSSTDPSREATGVRDTIEYKLLSTPGDPMGSRMGKTPRELLQEARESAPAVKGAPPPDERSKLIQQAARNLRTRIEDLRREIVSKLHEHAAFSVACFLMVLTGAVVALRMRDSLALPVYLWSFLPALLTVITISAGQGLTHAVGPPGLVLLWGGVAMLGLFTLREYAKLRRH